MVVFKSIADGKTISNDTLKMKSALEVCKIEGKKQNFLEAFDYGIQAYHLAEKLQDTLVLSYASKKLGNLYKEFGKEELSLKYLRKHLSLNKFLFKEKKVKKNRISAAHFDLGMHFRKFKKYDLALKHLDTCAILSKEYNASMLNQSYHRAEQASIYKDIGDLDKAQSILINIEKLFNQTKEKGKGIKSFMTVVYAYLGDVYFIEKEYGKAVNYYEKSLENNQKFKNNNSLIPTVLENLATCKFQIGEFQKAYKDLKESKKLNYDSFNVTSRKNSSLIEIKTNYQEQLDEQKELLSKQKEQNFIAKILIVVLVLIIAISVLLFRNYVQKSNFNFERKLLKEQEKQSLHKLKTKNKELTAYTLQLIEKEEVVLELSQKLKQFSTEDNSIKPMLKSLKVRSDALWEDFNKRFVQVNQSFYQKLEEKYPNLSYTEKKHCALIKLNFSGKDMAHLLGISLHSVHVSRYRLRKKFGLSREDNLAEFMSKI